MPRASPRAERALLWALALVVVLPPAAAAAEPPARADFAALAASFHALADDPASGEAAGNATAAWDVLAHPARELSPHAGETIDGMVAFLREESAAGNASNVRDLARAAARSAERDLLPAVDAWATLRAYVVAGPPQAASGDRLRVPLVLVNPPPGGVGAFDVRAAVDSTRAHVVDAAVGAGEGEATVEEDRNAGRVAAFDAKALAGLGQGSSPVVLGHVVLEPAGGGWGGPVSVAVNVIDLADATGEAVPAMGLVADVDPSGASAGGVPWRWVAPALVIALAGAAVVAARKLVKV